MNEPLHSHSYQHIPPLNAHLFATAPAAAQLVPHDLDSIDFSSFETALNDQDGLVSFEASPHTYDANPQARFHDLRTSDPLNAFQTQPSPVGNQFNVSSRIQTRQQQNEPSRQGGQFGVLQLQQAALQPRSHASALGHLQHEIDLRPKPVPEGGTTDGHFSNLKMIPDPPDLHEWRQKLFDVDDTITMTEDEFQTYFPHVDNIYSHRSTQKYKRKPFVSHYWDCRLKGRPPGTAKSEDPNKKKRKRQARERDLCDVKIKITEYFPGAKISEQSGPPGDDANPFGETSSANNEHPPPPTTILGSNDGTRKKNDGTVPPGTRYYTIQRVNGNGANGKDLATPGGHKHTLEDSDKIKKNSIVRYYMKEEKEKRKTQKTYHKKATGPALNTVKKHSKDHDLKLFGSCFCPFVQRVWISLELKGLPYQYVEIDPYKKPDQLLAINPRGLVPALRHGDWGCYESSVLMEYLEDLNAGAPLFPLDAKGRAHCRLWSDHINRKILPLFYGLLQAQEPDKQAENAAELKDEINTIINASDPVGPFFLGPHISFVDVQFAPWIVRLRKVLAPYRGWPDPIPGTRWAKWVESVEANAGVRATTSDDGLYLDSYERYAENRPNTSEVAKAVNEGRGLP